MEITATDFRSKNGSLEALVSARDIDGSLLYSDTIRLDHANDRRKFAEQLAARLDTTDQKNRIEHLEGRLLELFDKAVKEHSETNADGKNLLSALLGGKESTATRLVKLAEPAELFFDDN